MKKILLTGNLGYIGSVMTKFLIERGYEVIGIDSGLYFDSFLTDYVKASKQITKDIRNISLDDLKNIDAVIHLAGLSNDPLGDLNQKLTYDINYSASLKLAKLAKDSNVKRFIYASSQSVYGVSSSSLEVTEDSPTNPITAYAKSKLMTEKELSKMSNLNFACTSLRPATAYGASPNLRLDIVLNSFVADAFYKNKVIIKSDGRPWRPMSHVLDICKAFEACLIAPLDLIENQIFNIGTNSNNYTVRDLAQAVINEFPNAELTYTNEHIDSRSYRVSSFKILSALKDYYKPTENIQSGIKEIYEFLNNLDSKADITDSFKTRRLLNLKDKINLGILDSNLYFKV
jgi:nucleoside-diphosphate-sugar epimerase